MKKFILRRLGAYIAFGSVAFALMLSSCDGEFTANENDGNEETLSSESPKEGTYKLTGVYVYGEGTDDNGTTFTEKATITITDTSITMVETISYFEGDTIEVITKTDSGYKCERGSSLDNLSEETLDAWKKRAEETWNKYSSSYITFSSDGSCTVSQGGTESSGTYTVSGTSCTITTASEETVASTSDLWLTITTQETQVSVENNSTVTAKITNTYTRQ